MGIAIDYHLMMMAWFQTGDVQSKAQVTQFTNTYRHYEAEKG